jgi:anti-sigma factor ChrR (cupin superfamily)
MTNQTFTSPQDGSWLKIDFLPGVELLPLAQPVQDGSIHKARLAKGTIIPVHTHPADEFVLVLSGIVETGGHRCEAGAFGRPRPGRAKGRMLLSPLPSF